MKLSNLNGSRAREARLAGSSWRIGRRVLSLAIPHAKMLGLGLLALTLASGINLLFPYFIGKALNGDLGIVLERDIGQVIGVLVVLFVLQAGFFYLRHQTFWVVGYRVVSELRKKLYRSIITQDIAFFDSARVGDLLSRLSSDTQLVQRAVTVNISVALRYALQVVAGTALMLFISVKLTLVILVPVPLIVLSSLFWGRALRGLSRRMQSELADASVVAEETIGFVRTVRAFAGTTHELLRYGKAIDTALDTGEKRARTAAIFSSSMVFLIHTSIALVVWYGAHLVFSEALLIGDLTAFLLYCLIVAMSFAFLANVFDEFMQAVGAAERIFEIIDTESQVMEPMHPTPLPETSAGSVSFRNVSFNYPARPDSKILDDISFEVKPGETVALVGPSGAGKSTIASLIPRFYDPSQGEIRYCEVPLTAIKLDELREDISLVSQDPQVFSVSIGENILYGKLEATSAEVLEAAKAANIDEFISSLPDGFDTPVGDRGVQLSGGQRQRIVIARALLRNPKFLILDEATSSLDSENEHLVQEALNRLMEGRTVLVIAHRLSTVQHADRVLVIRDGKICQTGTHKSLVEEQGLYRTLVEHQLL